VFLCVYLGLPISNQRLKKSDLMPWIEKIGNKLPGWKATLMNMVGRTTWARFVISAIPIYVLIAIKVPKWFIKAIDKIRRAFVWKGRQQVNGGTCLVAWDKVQRPLDLGGLGILNLEYLSWALQIRWLWLQKTGDARAWKGLQIPVHANAFALFLVAINTVIGNGTNTLFWTDKWFMGISLVELAPSVLQVVPLKTHKMRLVSEALNDHKWIPDIRGGLSMVGLYDFFQLWDAIQEVTLAAHEDQHIWRFSSSGNYSSKSAYRAFFQGSMTFEPWQHIWKSWAPGKCKIFL
jgi:hypothetical protein